MPNECIMHCIIGMNYRVFSYLYTCMHTCVLLSIHVNLVNCIFSSGPASVFWCSCRHKEVCTQKHHLSPELGNVYPASKIPTNVFLFILYKYSVHYRVFYIKFIINYSQYDYFRVSWSFIGLGDPRYRALICVGILMMRQLILMVLQWTMQDEVVDTLLYNHVVDTALYTMMVQLRMCVSHTTW